MKTPQQVAENTAARSHLLSPAEKNRVRAVWHEISHVVPGSRSHGGGSLGVRTACGPGSPENPPVPTSVSERRIRTGTSS
jgi:hypothetical protein